MRSVMRLAALFPLSLALFFLSKVADPDAYPTLVNIDWMPALGINLSFNFDGIALLMAVLISGIGFLIFVYAARYLEHDPQTGRFFFILSLFMISMLGIVISDNLIVLFIFWELTSVTSYLLIGFKHEKQESRTNALQALLVTGAGGLCLLASFILIGQITGTYRISSILEMGEFIRENSQFSLILTLMLAGAFTKSAQFPFHFWLPNAMSAPTPVSAYLHSSTMVKAGVFLLIRFYPVFGSTLLWQNVLTWAGFLTITTGVFMSFSGKEDMKKQLAYMTITSLGILVLMLGLAVPYAVHACIVFLLGHSFYKASLFMIVGAIDHQVHTRNAFAMKGLLSRMPMIWFAGFLAALSMAGIPPFIGFIGKEILFEAALKSQAIWIAGAGLTFAGLAFVIYALVISVRPFFGELNEKSQHAKEPAFELWLCPMVLAVGGAVLGIFPHLADRIIQPVLQSMHPEIYFSQTKLWHGVNIPLMWSSAVLICGIALYLMFEKVNTAWRKVSAITLIGPQAVYFAGLEGMMRFSQFLAKALQNGHLRNYLRVTIFAVPLFCGAVLLRAELHMPADLSFGWLETFFCILIIVATAASVVFSDRLSSVACLGVVGIAGSLLFVVFSAPDLAMTQFAVDMLSVILLALVLCRMPRSEKRFVEFRLVDMVISATAGFTMFIFTCFLMSENRTAIPEVSQYIVANSLSKAYGGNLVNTILVDFRALDTLGEIVVLSVAGLGSFTLLRFGKQKTGGIK